MPPTELTSPEMTVPIGGDPTEPTAMRLERDIVNRSFTAVGNDMQVARDVFDLRTGNTSALNEITIAFGCGVEAQHTESGTRYTFGGNNQWQVDTDPSGNPTGVRHQDTTYSPDPNGAGWLDGRTGERVALSFSAGRNGDGTDVRAQITIRSPQETLSHDSDNGLTFRDFRQGPDNRGMLLIDDGSRTVAAVIDNVLYDVNADDRLERNGRPTLMTLNPSDQSIVMNAPDRTVTHRADGSIEESGWESPADRSAYPDEPTSTARTLPGGGRLLTFRNAGGRNGIVEMHDTLGRLFRQVQQRAVVAPAPEPGDNDSTTSNLRTGIPVYHPGGTQIYTYRTAADGTREQLPVSISGKPDERKIHFAGNIDAITGQVHAAANQDVNGNIIGNSQMFNPDGSVTTTIGGNRHVESPISQSTAVFNAEGRFTQLLNNRSNPPQIRYRVEEELGRDAAGNPNPGSIIDANNRSVDLDGATSLTITGQGDIIGWNSNRPVIVLHADGGVTTQLRNGDFRTSFGGAQNESHQVNWRPNGEILSVTRGDGTPVASNIRYQNGRIQQANISGQAYAVGRDGITNIAMDNTGETTITRERPGQIIRVSGAGMEAITANGNDAVAREFTVYRTPNPQGNPAIWYVADRNAPNGFGWQASDNEITFDQNTGVVTIVRENANPVVLSPARRPPSPTAAARRGF